MKPTPRLSDLQVPVKVKLSALWTSLMFLYVYGDYFGLYKIGQLDAMLEGRIPPLGQVTQGVLVGTSLMMAIPESHGLPLRSPASKGQSVPEYPLMNDLHGDYRPDHARSLAVLQVLGCYRSGRVASDRLARVDVAENR